MRSFWPMVFLLAAPLAAGAAETEPLMLWYRAPARVWNEALPIGNGRLGAMVYGDPAAEHLQLNENSVWSGERHFNPAPQVKENLPAVRKLLFEGKYAEAQALAEKTMTTPKDPRYGHYQPLGHLKLAFDPFGGDVAAYRRQLDLDRAVTAVSFRVGDATFTREYFASAPAQVLVARLSCDKPGRLSFTIDLSREKEAVTRNEGDDQLLMSGQCSLNGSKFHARLKVIQQGGTRSVRENALRVERADSVTILLAANTDYYGKDPEGRNAEQLSKAAALDLLNAHVADYQKLFRRVTLDLGRTDAAALPIDERLKNIAKGTDDPQLATLYFQFGRYLLISSSRPGSLPANLQGLWNDSYTPSWFSDFTININTQMNYWPAEVTNLSECHEPLFDLIEMLREPGRQTARERYGCRGFVLSTRTNPWGCTDLRATASLLYQDAAAWLCLHLWEHYRFTGDREFLARRAYPVMKEAAEFYVDFLAEQPGTGLLVSGPATSPENCFLTAEKKKISISMGPTMSQQIIRELFTHCIEASELLAQDEGFRGELKKKLERLAPMKIAKDGRLQEWLEDFRDAEPGHRHMSHLFGLHPGTQITPRGTPELAAAARKTLDARLSSGGGHTGWSRAWIINFFARLEDGAKAHENFKALLAKSTLPNLFDNHPPFQIDGNFGGASGLAEMLLQSHAGEIALLPALPPAWPNGSVKGLKARGGFEIDLSWREGRLQRTTIRSTSGGRCTLRYDRATAELEMKAGESRELDAALRPAGQ